MVIGNGMVARRFESYKTNDQFLIFASGVSNSKNINPEAYARELLLLQTTIKQNPEKILVYFSTCSVYDPGEENSKYVVHKKQIEQLIQSNQRRFCIFRVSNLVGHSGNRNTILNFYVYHILNGINFDLWTNATRNLIDIDDMYQIADDILKKGNAYAVCGKSGVAQSALKRLTVSGDTMHIKLVHEAKEIRLIGQNGVLKKTVADSDSAMYIFKATDTYIRAEIINDKSKLYLNPVIRCNNNQFPLNNCTASVNMIATFFYRALVLFLFITILLLFYKRSFLKLLYLHKKPSLAQD